MCIVYLYSRLAVYRSGRSECALIRESVFTCLAVYEHQARLVKLHVFL